MTENAALYDLEKHMAAAREVDTFAPLGFREALVSHGDGAVKAMSYRIGDPDPGSIDTRIPERISGTREDHTAMAEVLPVVDRDDLPARVAADLDKALASLGWRQSTPRASVRASSPARPAGSPRGKGRGYWVMRASPSDRRYGPSNCT
jgi:hypothetical protein